MDDENYENQVLLWAEYNITVSRRNHKDVKTGFLLEKSVDTYTVVRSVDDTTQVEAFGGHSIDVGKDFLDDITDAPDKLYPQLIERINSLLSSRNIVLEDGDARTVAKKDDSIDVLLIGIVGNVSKAVGLKRKDDGFILCAKADNESDIAKLKELATDEPIDVGINQIIAILSKRKNAKIGEMIDSSYSAIVEQLL